MKKSKKVLKSYFESGDKPTQMQFEDLIDSLVHQDDETKIYIAKVETNNYGDTIVTLSNGQTITVEKPRIYQDNKIRVVDLGDVSIFVGNSHVNFSKDQTLKSSEEGVPLPPPQPPLRVEQLLTEMLNQLNPPITILEDEIVVFEYNLIEHRGS